MIDRLADGSPDVSDAFARARIHGGSSSAQLCSGLPVWGRMVVAGAAGLSPAEGGPTAQEGQCVEGKADDATEMRAEPNGARVLNGGQVLICV